MSYQINKTDGTIIATVADGTVDILSTDLALIGKNYSGYGDYLNENFIKLLENFADTRRPVNPIVGQLWYDTTDEALKIYSGKDFVPVSSTTISERQPTGLRVGDLWYDNTNKQLKFYDGATLTTLAPNYTRSQGKSGFVVETVLDVQNQSRTITSLYNNDVLIGIYSNSAFTPKVPMAGYSGTIKIGFNASTLSGMKFNVTCTNAEKFAGLLPTDFLRSDVPNILNEELYIASDGGVLIGGSSVTGSFTVASDAVVLSNLIPGGQLRLQVARGIANDPVMTVFPNEQKVWFYKDITLGNYVDSLVEFGGDVTVHGNLIVNGDTTVLSTTELVVEDKNIVLGSLGNSSLSTDVLAQGGGITLVGSTYKTITWETDLNPFGMWTSSEHFDLAAGKHYAINGSTLLAPVDPNDPGQGYKLTDNIVAIDGIASILFNDTGKRQSLSIAPGANDPITLKIEGTSVTTYSNLDLILSPDGNIVCTTDPVLKGLGEPVDAQDAATKNYVDTTVDTKMLFLSTTTHTTEALAEDDLKDLLNTMIPSGTVGIGTIVRLLVTSVTNVANTSTPNVNVTKSQFALDGGGTGLAVTDVDVDDLNIAAQEMTVTRKVWQFIYNGAPNWVYDDLNSTNWIPLP